MQLRDALSGVLNASLFLGLLLASPGCGVDQLRFINPTPLIELDAGDEGGVVLAVQALGTTGHPAKHTARQVEWIFAGRDVEVRALNESDWRGVCPTERQVAAADDDDDSAADDDDSAVLVEPEVQESTQLVAPVHPELCFAHADGRLQPIDCACDDVPPTLVGAVSAVIVQGADWLGPRDETQLIGLATLGATTPRTFVIQE